jgi:predicted AAA+ superfamily ATPase
MINRTLDLTSLLKKGDSAFLFGPRGVGKTMLAGRFLKQDGQTLAIDLLSYELFSRYISQPGLFRHEIE